MSVKADARALTRRHYKPLNITDSSTFTKEPICSPACPGVLTSENIRFFDELNEMLTKKLKLFRRTTNLHRFRTPTGRAVVARTCACAERTCVAQSGGFAHPGNLSSMTTVPLS